MRAFSLGAGSTFGELALLNPQSARNASVVADTACDLLVISSELYSKCIKVFFDFKKLYEISKLTSTSNVRVYNL